MAYTLPELITAVRDLLNEEAPGFYSDAMLSRWLEQATLDISTVSKCVERVSQIGMQGGTPDYQAPGASLEILHAIWMPTRQGLRKITPSMAGEASHELEDDQPRRWWEWGGRFFVEPVPNAAASGQNVELYYASVTNVATELPDAYQFLAIYYATALGRTRNLQGASAAQLYSVYANALGFRRLDIQQRLPQTEADVSLAALAVER